MSTPPRSTTRRQFLKTGVGITSLLASGGVLPGGSRGDAAESLPADNADRPVLTVDAAKRLGPFKPLHGVNGGPRINLGTTYDNRDYFRAFQPPLIRTHDSAYADLDTCDIHAIFPDFDADEQDPGNYRFQKTDLYLQSIRDVGSGILFRLGESIEPGTPKYYTQPPADFGKWARICRQIVRHYNQGWADGFTWNIRYWEIWNEPNNPSCWSGTMEQYCELYRETALALKELDPGLKVGGPGLASGLGNRRGHGRQFLAFCRDKQVPLDFASWHGYSSKPDSLMRNVEAGIAVLREHGFEHTESHFTEWNYGLGDTLETREEVRAHFLRLRGGPGAAFAASILAYLQETELDVAGFYSAYGTIFRTGFFDIYGVPSRQFDVFKAFHQLVHCGTRIEVSGNNRKSGVGVVAAINPESGKTAVLLSNLDDESPRFNLELNHLPVQERWFCTEYIIDDHRALARDRESTVNIGNSSMEVELPKGTVRLILLTPEPVRDEL